MKWCSASLPLVAALLVAPAAAGQSVGDDVEWSVKTMLHIWSSPARMQAADLLPIGVVAAATAGALPIDDDVWHWLRTHDESVFVRVFEKFGEPSPLNLAGRTLPIQTLSLLLYGIGHAVDSSDLREAAMGCSTANVSSTLVRGLVSDLIGRLRPRYGGGPYVFEPFAFGPWSMRAFPAGHVANVMTCASFWNHRFDLGIAEPLLYALAAAIGIGRLIDGAHWLSDTVFGLSLGYAVGKGVAARSRSHWADADADAQDDLAIRVGWQIRF